MYLDLCKERYTKTEIRMEGGGEKRAICWKSKELNSVKSRGLRVRSFLLFHNPYLDFCISFDM